MKKSISTFITAIWCSLDRMIVPPPIVQKTKQKDQQHMMLEIHSIYPDLSVEFLILNISMLMVYLT